MLLSSSGMSEELVPGIMRYVASAHFARRLVGWGHAIQRHQCLQRPQRQQAISKEPQTLLPAFID